MWHSDVECTWEVAEWGRGQRAGRLRRRRIFGTGSVGPAGSKMKQVERFHLPRL